MQKRRKISVVVEASEAAHGESCIQLTDALNSLERQNYPKELTEIIVITAGWDGEAIQKYAEAFPHCRIHFYKDTGYFRVKNYGATLATGEIIALADSDCIYDKGWLKSINDAIIDENTVSAGLTELDTGTLISRMCAFYDMHWMLFRVSGKIKRFNSNNVAFPAKLFKETGYNPTFDRFGGCVNLAWRLNRNGVAIVFAEKQHARHNYYGIFRHSWVHAIANGYHTITIRKKDRKIPLSGLLRVPFLAPPVLTALFFSADMLNLLQNRKLLRIQFFEFPFFITFSLSVRLLEIIGMYWVMLSPLSIEKYIDRRLA